MVKGLTAIRRRQSALYTPYSKQEIFHELGATKRERLILAGNQLGKTKAGGMELRYHTTGEYPPWWTGKRFYGPTKWWASNSTNESVRDNPQRILMGAFGEFGTGALPGNRIEGHTMARGFPELCDKVRIRHAAGGCSQIQFKAYEQGRLRWQGETLTGGIWFDEEPPSDIYSEGVARLAPGAVCFITATPLLGMSEVVMHFYPHPDTADRGLVQMAIEDAGHYTPKERAQRIAGYPAHEREARAQGIPMLGEGRIFPISKSQIEEDAIETIPPHWPQINGIDFGFVHPFAAVNIAWDRDNDCAHITKTYRQTDVLPPVHVSAIKPWGEWIRNAWPHDGTHTEKGSGEVFMRQYKKLGLLMLPEHATHYGGGYYVEPGLIDMEQRMQSGRLKVASHLSMWFAEFLAYHRLNGQIVKKNDDLMDATRAALMVMQRYSRTNRAVIQPMTVGLDFNPIGPN